MYLYCIKCYYKAPWSIHSAQMHPPSPHPWSSYACDAICLPITIIAHEGHQIIYICSNISMYQPINHGCCLWSKWSGGIRKSTPRSAVPLFRWSAFQYTWLHRFNAQVMRYCQINVLHTQSASSSENNKQKCVPSPFSNFRLITPSSKTGDVQECHLKSNFICIPR